MGKVVNVVLALLGVVFFARAGFGGWLDAWLLVVTDDPQRSGGARVLAGLTAFVAGVYGLLDSERSERAERFRRRNTELELEVLALTAELGRGNKVAATSPPLGADGDPAVSR